MSHSEKALFGCCDRKFVVVEIIFFLFKIGDAMLDPAIRLFIYQGVCLQNFANHSVCYELSVHPEQENFVQARSASFIMYFKLLLNLPAVFLCLFCGAWSDRVGRKLPVLMSPLGTILGVMCLMMSMMVEGERPFLSLILTAACIRGAFGKSAVITMALHSYVSDTSAHEQRTKRLGKLLAMNFYGYFAGSLLVGALLRICNFDVIFCTVVSVQCFCVIITVLFMKDSRPPAPGTEGSPLTTDDKSDVNKIPFHWRHVVDSINVLYRPRENKGRLLLLLFFFLVISQQVCKSGETDTTLLYVERSPLHWDKSLYGFLLATDYACLGLAVFFLLPLLIRLFDLQDMTLILIGLVFKAVRLAILAFSSHTWMVYLSVVIGCPSAMIISGSKSLISKSVGEDEMGKTFSLLSAGETVSNLLGSVIFTSIYSATFTIFGGMTFLMDAIFQVGLFVSLLGVYRCLLTNSRKTAQLKEAFGIKKNSLPGYGTTSDSYLTIDDDKNKNSNLPLLPEVDEMESGSDDIRQTESAQNDDSFPEKQEN